MKRGVSRFGVLVGLVALLGGCAAPQGAHEYHPLYPEYMDAEDLAAAATDIVVGTVESAEVRRIDISAPSDSTDPVENPTYGAGEEAHDASYVYTVLQLRVEETYKGSRAPGEVIEVKQLGGTFEGEEYLEEGATALSIDSTYALFLMSFDNVPASLLNASQASYIRDANGAFAPVDPRNSIGPEVVRLLSHDNPGVLRSAPQPRASASGAALPSATRTTRGDRA